MNATPSRPPFIGNVRDLKKHQHQYPGDDERLSVGTLLSRQLGLTRLGVWHEELSPGVRTSWPHAEEKEEELVYVLEGAPDAWVDGVLHRLAPGDCIAFAPGTGVTHTMINNTDAVARLLCVGEKLANNRYFYPLHANGYDGMPASETWSNPPIRRLGGHDGMSDKERTRRSSST